MKRKPQPKTPPATSHGNHHQYSHTHIGNPTTVKRSKSDGKDSNDPSQQHHQQQQFIQPHSQMHCGNHHNSNRHNKSRSNMSPQNVPNVIFNKGEIVLYNGIEAEVEKIHQDGKIEISHPVSAYILKRSRAKVPPFHLQKRGNGHSVHSGHRHTQSPMSNPNLHHKNNKYDAHGHGQQHQQQHSYRRHPPPHQQQNHHMQQQQQSPNNPMRQHYG